MRDIGIDKYTTAEYAIFDIYFPETYQSALVITYITRETYIVNNLKVKIFIKLNVCGLKKINIYISKKVLYIELYKVNVFILIKIRANNSICRIVYTKFNIIIPFNSTVAISIYCKNIPPLHVSIYPVFAGISPTFIS